MLERRAASITDQARPLARRFRRRLARRPFFDPGGLSPARRFLLVSLVVVVVGAAAVAFVLGQLIETSATNRTTSVTAL